MIAIEGSKVLAIATMAQADSNTLPVGVCVRCFILDVDQTRGTNSPIFHPQHLSIKTVCLSSAGTVGVPPVACNDQKLFSCVLDFY